ncbi:hypothetical protein ADK36_12280 [Streptomyces viridochromogenes]|nr:hypothetical protein ADK36_12280 [Streptomyces viridochromogenes]
MLPKDEEVYSKPFGNCHCLVLGGGLSLASTQVADLAGVASGGVGELSDADRSSVAGALHELDQQVSLDEDHGVLLGTHAFTSVNVLCVFVNKADSTCS